jgi:hypothetical protein
LCFGRLPPGEIPRDSLDGRLGGHLSRSSLCREDKYLMPLKEIKLRFLGHSSRVPTELPQSLLLSLEECGVGKHVDLKRMKLDWKQRNRVRFKVILHSVRSRDSSVGIGTGYGLKDGGVGVRVPVGQEFSFPMSSRPAVGSTQPPIRWVPGAISSGVKRPGHEADHSHPTSAEIKKIWIYTSTPHTPS